MPTASRHACAVPIRHEGNSHTHLVSRLAGDQAGVVARAQLLEHDVPGTAIESWIRCGRLLQIHRGVYAFGHAALSFEGRCMAAVLAVGGDAVVTGAAAGYLRGVERRAPAMVEVTTTRHVRCDHDGVAVLRVRRLPAADRDRLGPVPIGSVARMLVDRARTASSTELADVMHECEYRRILDVRALEACARRHRTRSGPGPRRMQQALALHHSGSAGTQSAFERRVLGKLLDAGAPMPSITPSIELADGRRIRPDLLFERERLVVEVDGRRSHDRRRTRVRDARKEEDLRELGYVVVRVRDRELPADVCTVLATLRARR